MDQAEVPMALARLGFDAMDRMIRSLRAANDAVLEATQAAVAQPAAASAPPPAEDRRRGATTR
jgi:hypothetical protein